MINSLVRLLNDKSGIVKSESGDYLHVQAAKHPENALIPSPGVSQLTSGQKEKQGSDQNRSAD
jgi:hypothetical protein